ncbi:MAG TPA: hypothetical protein VJV04_03105 [Nitrospiraceae bacterium]|nr:hypothetical protein [Nitrospiraceae bacterium]
MFVSLNTPDQIFQDIVAEALELAISDISATSANPRTYRQLFPRTSQYIECRAAHDLLHILKCYNLAPEWYRLQSLHRVLLCDVIRRYCEQHNAQPRVTRLYAHYGLERLEWAPMLRFFIGEPYQDGSFAAPLSQDAMELRASDDCGQQPVIRAEQSPFYRRGVPIYPAPRDIPK